VHGYGQDMKTC